MQNIQTKLGDCIDVMKQMRDNSIDSIVTDPPAGIAFMGKDWDKDKGGRDPWIEWMTSVAIECLRVLKPGGHALVWSIPRTSHWTATAWENAGFEVRDRVSHLFGSGFPKSHNISKAIDKVAGAEREVVKTIRTRGGGTEHINRENVLQEFRPNAYQKGENVLDITSPATPEAQQWDGWGTSLKPCIEDWWLLRKPLSEKTIAENVLKWGTGAINIDECRVPTNSEIDDPRLGGNGSWKTDKAAKNVYEGGYEGKDIQSSSLGRWPAQLIHDGSDVVLEGFPETKSGAMKHDVNAYDGDGVTGFLRGKSNPQNQRADSGSAARFFYCAKPSKKERNDGLDGMEEKDMGHNRFDKCSTCGGTIFQNPDRPSACKCENPIRENNMVKGNFHPTVKPLSLMRYLITLITPPNGTVLDPFLGSGTTLVAAKELGFSGRGIENDPEYLEIANRRINNAKYT